MSCSSREKQVDGMLKGVNDNHGGVTVEMNGEPLDPVVFTSLLRASLAQWRQQGKKGIWIKMPIELASLVEPAVKWLPRTANTLPANATHRVGIGALVLNDKDEVLVVQEKSGWLRGMDVWKYPTGVVEEGEDICDAAVREVKEETGVDAKFVEVLAFRQAHRAFFDKSDLFFACLMKPLSFDIQPQESEIEAAQWMPFEEYAAQPFVQKHELMRYIVDICRAKKASKYSGFLPVPTTNRCSGAKDYLYLNRRDLMSSKI